MADSRSAVESKSLECSESADPDKREVEEEELSGKERSEGSLTDGTFQEIDDDQYLEGRARKEYGSR